MSDPFYEQPILNSPYAPPARYWELDKDGQPTQKVVETRRKADFITPIPKPKKRKGKKDQQADIVFDEGKGLSTANQQYESMSIINEIRQTVSAWRDKLKPSEWGVTPETARLLKHWRFHKFSGVRPFFCQVEAVETAIWLTEVAPHTAAGKRILEYLAQANDDANPGLYRLALKLATGAGKTTVMAMLIAWQTVNSVRRPGSKHFTRGFLIVAPGLTIKDRLRVLLPNDPDNYYGTRELVPGDMLADMQRAKIVITNYHSFMLRERLDVSAGTRGLLKGRSGEDLQTKETEGQMLQRVVPDLMGMKNVMVINDEAHHCYRSKPQEEDDEALKGDDRKEAEQNNEKARVWISGLEILNRKLNVLRVFDLSATPFFLQGSGYAEGTLFPWTMSDFSLMDAIECGIVKLPRVPVAENIPGDEMPMFRMLWHHIRADMPKKGRGTAGSLDPLKLPARLQTALHALYGHYDKTFKLWQESRIEVPPCFIIVCQNTAISKLVFDYVSGFERENADGTKTLENGRLPLFRNFDAHGKPLAKPNTLLIDSEQLESGDALDSGFRAMAADEIERFRREIVERTGRQQDTADLGDRPVVAMLDAYNSTGSTRFVNFNTSRDTRWQTASDKCQVNWVIYDSDWEAELCRVVENHPQVRAYVKNHNLGFEVPYRYGCDVRKYFPDFIVDVDDGHGADDLLHLVVEIKGFRREDAKEKAATMATYWVPGVNQLGTHGRWSFAELTEVYTIETDFAAKVEGCFTEMVARVARSDAYDRGGAVVG
ncbi:MAG: DEAD/DEAH box helicase family protein, partial [Planctomycetota bacterium]